MLLGAHSTLQELLVHALTKRISAAAEDLLREVSKKKRTFTVQAVYKELRNLQDQGIVFKQGRHYSLSLSWILNLWDLADSLLELHGREPVCEFALPAEGHKRTLTFSRLTHLDDFWIHYLLLMLQNSQAKVLYSWLPHPWFHLVHSHKSGPLHEAIRVGGFKVHCIIGGRTFLDQYSKRITSKGVYEFHYAPGPFQEQSLYYLATDSFLMTVRLDSGLMKSVESVYDSVKSMNELDLGKVLAAVRKTGRITVTMEAKTRKAARIWRQFREYFEVI